MPSTTIGATVASVLQFIAVMLMLTVVLNARTTTGNGVLPPGVATNVTGLLNNESNAYLNTSPSSNTIIHIRANLGAQTNQTSGSLSNIGVLSQLSGLAFIPAAFGLFITTMFQLPNTMITIVNTLLTQPGNVNNLIGFSVLAMSGCLMSYYVIIFSMKLVSPISKTEIEDV